jgi:microsomal dipeptidase-like Zn-dependent dipeptidase
MTEIDTRIDPTDTVHVWTEQARARWTEMIVHLEKLQRCYGARSKQYIEAANSFGRISSSLVGFGNLRVMTDMADLSLFCSAGSFVFGLIWHQERRSCTNDGCKAVINDDGKAWVYMPDWHMCDEHVLSYPLDAPHPGTWSFHS